MVERMVAGKSIDQWKAEFALLDPIIALREVFWSNPQYLPGNPYHGESYLNQTDIYDAEKRLLRFAPYIAKRFPETESAGGIIESPLRRIAKMQRRLTELFQQEIGGTLYLKCDSHLPICGSIKARGGVYEVLKLAETIALQRNLLLPAADYLLFDSGKFREVFSEYSLVVSSTGNLGLSVGIMGAALGFKVIVHMSVDAKQWKKDLLKAKGVTVIEHKVDYSAAVIAGRQEAQRDPNCHFVDDENSLDLFLGYAVAAKRLQHQLMESNIVVDQDHPLFVYLPCGVGGAPGGITFGLKTVFNDNVHCFFAEPTHAPAMLIGLMTQLHDQASVQDFGIDNCTAADGLAVGRPSALVGKMIGPEIGGVFTVADRKLFQLLRALADTEQIYLEPSALAGFAGPVQLFSDSAGENFLAEKNLRAKMEQSTHIVWATGGSMVPAEVMNGFYYTANGS